MTKYFDDRTSCVAYLLSYGWRLAPSGRFLSADGFLVGAITEETNRVVLTLTYFM